MFKDRLKIARKNAKLSQKDLAAKLFISQQAYAKYETGTSSPNPETMKNIAYELGVSTDYLTGNDVVQEKTNAQSKKSIKIPVFGRVAAGIPIEAIEEILDYEEIPVSMAETGEYFALQIKGDSMEPKISDGDVVIVRRQSDVENGQLAIVIVNGDEATCKKIKKSPEGILLIPNNSSYEVTFFSNKEIAEIPIIIIGRVVELRAKF